MKARATPSSTATRCWRATGSARTGTPALGVGKLLGVDVLPLRLVDGRWYHVDTCLIPVSPELLAYYPPAFDAEANAALEALPGDKILLTESDALRFGGNAVVVGDQVVMNSGCDALGRVAVITRLHSSCDRPIGVPEVRRLRQVPRPWPWIIRVVLVVG